MAINCEFFDFIVPIENIEKVYKGGFERFKSDHIEDFGERYQHDDFLLRDDAINTMDKHKVIHQWKKLGLKAKINEGIKEQWKDFCIVDSAKDGPTLRCDWIDFDPETRTVSYKGKP